MQTSTEIILALTLYKIVSITAGTIFAYMGYRLFMVGVWGSSGDIEAKFRENKLIVKQAAPGTFFALFGTIVVAVALFKGLELNDRGGSKSTVSAFEVIKEQGNDLPNEPPF